MGSVGAAGCAALREAALSSLPARRLPARGATEEPRGRSGQPRPRRRPETLPEARDGARGAPCWEPLRTARG